MRDNTHTRTDVVEKRADELRPGDTLVRLGMVGEVLATHVGRTVRDVTIDRFPWGVQVRVTFTDGTTARDDGSGLVAVGGRRRVCGVHMLGGLLCSLPLHHDEDHGVEVFGHWATRVNRGEGPTGDPHARDWDDPGAQFPPVVGTDY